MNITEQEVRALVREAIERHLRPDTGASHPAVGGVNAPHSSHVLLQVAAGSDLDEGACVIEPAVRCTHCGFCRSYGH